MDDLDISDLEIEDYCQLKINLALEKQRASIVSMIRGEAEDVTKTWAAYDEWNKVADLIENME